MIGLKQQIADLSCRVFEFLPRDCDWHTHTTTESGVGSRYTAYLRNHMYVTNVIWFLIPSFLFLFYSEDSSKGTLFFSSTHFVRATQRGIETEQ